MTSTTFGYDQEEDRLWICHNDEHPRIWLTRRFTQGLLGPMADLIEKTTTVSAYSAGLSTTEQVLVIVRPVLLPDREPCKSANISYAL